MVWMLRSFNEWPARPNSNNLVQTFWAQPGIASKKCYEKVDPVALEPYTAFRTIALDKGGQDAVRPIGIGEILRKFIGKTRSKLLRVDVCEAVGVRQTRSGQENGSEAAFTAATKIDGLLSIECMLQIDASNAFKSMNREIIPHNAHFKFLKNPLLNNEHVP